MKEIRKPKFNTSEENNASINYSINLVACQYMARLITMDEAKLSVVKDVQQKFGWGTLVSDVFSAISDGEIIKYYPVEMF